MKVRVRLAIIAKLVLSLIGTSVQLHAEQSKISSVQSEMTFQIVQERDGDLHERVALIAVGRITSRTPYRFRSAARLLPPESAVYLDS